MTKTAKIAVTGFLGIMALSFGLTQGCGQSFKVSEGSSNVTPYTYEPPAPVIPTPVPVIPLVIDQVANHVGKVRLVRADSTDFNSFTSSIDPVVLQSVNQMFQRLLVYSPGFDSKQSWYDRGWAYSSFYGIPVSQANTTNDAYILRDQAGNRLFVEPNVYAANVLDLGYRAAWISNAKALVAKGYRGLFIDDVNLSYQVVNAAGTITSAYQNGAVISAGEWQTAVGLFAESIRQALPQTEIVHNSNWSADSAGSYMSDSQMRVINSAQAQFIENGIHQTGLTGGTVGVMTIFNQKKFVDRVHALNRSVVLGGVPAGLADKEYALAYYYLFSAGVDFLSDNNVNPTTPYAGYALDLGVPTGPAVRDGSVWTRQFSRGYVLLNEPGGFIQTVTTMGYKDLRGTMNSFTLAPRNGLILVPNQ